MSAPDIRIMRLAVTMRRDTGIKEDFLDWGDRVKDALLYIGVPVAIVTEKQHYDWSNSLTLSSLLNDLHERGMLAAFLTEMLRTGVMPEDAKEIVTHLQPLGLDLVEATNQIRPTTTRPEAEQTVRTELERLLSEIDRDFPKRLRGAWEAYYSDNPDRFRQAVTSCRELLADVTQKLGDSGTRRQKIERMLGSGVRAEVVDAAASLVEALYGIQSAQQHDKPDQSTALFALVETEHILYFLLTLSSIKERGKDVRGEFR